MLYYANLLEPFTFISKLELENMITWKKEVVPGSEKEITLEPWTRQFKRKKDMIKWMENMQKDGAKVSF